MERRGNPAFEAMLPRTEAFVAIASELGCTPSQLALAYCLTNPQVCSVVFGSRRVQQVEENVGALAVLPRLGSDVLSRLRAL